jgi:hypothetical protein
MRLVKIDTVNWPKRNFATFVTFSSYFDKIVYIICPSDDVELGYVSSKLYFMSVNKLGSLLSTFVAQFGEAWYKRSVHKSLVNVLVSRKQKHGDR